jgi:hypothetical protein
MVRGAGDTVKIVLPVMPLSVAEMVEVPRVAAVASPVVLIVATLVFDEAHVTEPVMFWVLLSEYVPVAVNCCVAPTWIVGVTGVTAMDCKVGAGATMMMLKALVAFCVPAPVTCTVKL